MPLPQLLSIIESLDEFKQLLDEMPSPGVRRQIGGLHGSSDAVVLAALTQNATRRFFVVVNDDVAGAERWLADLTTLVEAEAVAFYPPRESFGRPRPTPKSPEREWRLSSGWAGRSPDSHHHHTRDSRAHAASARARLGEARAAEGRLSPARSSRVAPRSDWVRARTYGGGRRSVQRARRNLRHLQLRNGGASPPRVLGR